MALKNYRAVTSGQSLDDAGIITFDWTGNTLRPLSPVNLRVTRNTSNDMYIEWTRRSRLASGLRPYSDVPIGEEIQRYDIEFYSGSTVVATYSVIVPPPFTPTRIQQFSVNSSGVTFNRSSVTQERLDTEDSWIEGNLQGLDTQLPSVGITDGALMFSGDDGSGGVMWNYPWLLSAGVDQTFGMSVVENGVTVYTQSVAYTPTTARVRVAIRNGRVEYYLNPIGANDVPLFTSARADIVGRADIRARFFEATTGANSVIDRKMQPGTVVPHFLYTAAQQTANGFTPGNAIKMRVYQVSSIVGRGAYIERTL